jgi:hypothetical protein
MKTEEDNFFESTSIKFELVFLFLFIFDLDYEMITIINLKIATNITSLHYGKFIYEKTIDKSTNERHNWQMSKIKVGVVRLHKV